MPAAAYVWVTLVPDAVGVLRARAAERVDGWVFPSLGSATGHVVEPRTESHVEPGVGQGVGVDKGSTGSTRL